MLANYQAHKRQNEEIEKLEDSIFPKSSSISHLIIIDREIDFVTPLMTQITYQGMLEEYLGINSGYVEVEADAEKELDKKDKDGKAKKEEEVAKKLLKYRLSDEDKIFGYIRDMSFGEVLSDMQKIAKSISSRALKPEDLKSLNIKALTNAVREVKDFLQEKQSLAFHVSLSQRVSDNSSNNFIANILSVEADIVNVINMSNNREIIDNFINRQRPLPSVFRLMCLYSQCNGGFKKEIFDIFREAILQTYGYPHLLTLANLEKVGLLCDKESKNKQKLASWKTLIKELQLIVESEEEEQERKKKKKHKKEANVVIKIKIKKKRNNQKKRVQVCAKFILIQDMFHYLYVVFKAY